MPVFLDVRNNFVDKVLIDDDLSVEAFIGAVGATYNVFLIIMSDFLHSSVDPYQVQRFTPTAIYDLKILPVR